MRLGVHHRARREGARRRRRGRAGARTAAARRARGRRATRASASRRCSPTARSSRAWTTTTASSRSSSRRARTRRSCCGALVATGAAIQRFELVQPSLHQIFLEQVGAHGRRGGDDAAMAKLWAVFKREYLERVRSKWFLIGTLLGPVFFLLVAGAPRLLGDRPRRQSRASPTSTSSTRPVPGSARASPPRCASATRSRRAPYLDRRRRDQACRRTRIARRSGCSGTR